MRARAGRTAGDGVIPGPLMHQQGRHLRSRAGVCLFRGSAGSCLPAGLHPSSGACTCDGAGPSVVGVDQVEAWVVLDDVHVVADPGYREQEAHRLRRRDQPRPVSELYAQARDRRDC